MSGGDPVHCFYFTTDLPAAIGYFLPIPAGQVRSLFPPPRLQPWPPRRVPVPGVRRDKVLAAVVGRVGAVEGSPRALD